MGARHMCLNEHVGFFFRLWSLKELTLQRSEWGLSGNWPHKQGTNPPPRKKNNNNKTCSCRPCTDLHVNGHSFINAPLGSHELPFLRTPRSQGRIAASFSRKKFSFSAFFPPSAQAKVPIFCERIYFTLCQAVSA